MIGDLLSRRAAAVPSYPLQSNLSRIEGSSSESIVHFSVDGRDFKEGAIRRGGRLTIDYDINRLQMQGQGQSTWDVVGHVLFHPGGQLYRGSLMSPRQDMRQMASLEVAVPHDATKVEMWFYCVDRAGHVRWDSQGGKNFTYLVEADALGTLRNAVEYRHGAISNASMVNVSEDLAFTKDISPSWGHQLGAPGLGPKTLLIMKAWVRNVSADKRAWADIHVFGRQDDLLHAESFPLRYMQPAEGGGDFFILDDIVYRGSQGMASSQPAPREARLIQYRLYVEANRSIYTDGLLHTLKVLEDEQGPTPIV
jgi:hypothetical protein